MKSLLHEQPERADVRMNPPGTAMVKTQLNGAARLAPAPGTALGYPRDFSDNRFVYTVISARARGLSVGVNMNPDQHCNFDCLYCEVKRGQPSGESRLDVPVMIGELKRTLESIRSGGLRERPCYQSAPPELLELRHVALSGDGEPTLCPNFSDAVEAIVQLRACGSLPHFKLVLITNASGLDRPEVVEGLRLFTPRDEVWAKLDAGTQGYMDRVNRPDCPIERILSNILSLAAKRPVVVQSLFPSINGQAPAVGEVEAFAQRLRELKEAGAQIPLVQIYSATRPTAHSACSHLALRPLSQIARRVREVSGLKAEVF